MEEEIEAKLNASFKKILAATDAMCLPLKTAKLLCFAHYRQENYCNVSDRLQCWSATLKLSRLQKAPNSAQTRLPNSGRVRRKLTHCLEGDPGRQRGTLKVLRTILKNTPAGGASRRSRMWRSSVCSVAVPGVPTVSPFFFVQ